MRRQQKRVSRLALLYSFLLLISVLTILGSSGVFLQKTVVIEQKVPTIQTLLYSPLRMSIGPPPSPTPKPTEYPPSGWHCISLPILMYHHVEPMLRAKAAGHGQLTVDSGIFAKQMDELSKHGYSPIHLSELAEYFDTGRPLPPKPIILTFDDGYSDFFDFALPILEAKGFKSVAFIPTGLLEKPGYLNWNHLKLMQAKNVEIGHHTFSHVHLDHFEPEFLAKQMDAPTKQLEEFGLGEITVFAYPYGTHTSQSEDEVAKRGFSLAVTTIQGQVQCKEDRFALHRTRIGNQTLKRYGL